MTTSTTQGDTTARHAESAASEFAKRYQHEPDRYKTTSFRLDPEDVAKLKVAARFHGRSQNAECTYALMIHNAKAYLAMLAQAPEDYRSQHEANARRELVRLEEAAFGRPGIDALIASFERAGLGEPDAN